MNIKHGDITPCHYGKKYTVLVIYFLYTVYYFNSERMPLSRYCDLMFTCVKGKTLLFNVISMIKCTQKCNKNNVNTLKYTANYL